jgi:hypothetical protein
LNVKFTPSQRAKRGIEFHWDETGFVGSGNTSQYMVYDETDCFPEKVRSGKTRWFPEMSAVTPMGRHLFLVVEAF